MSAMFEEPPLPSMMSSSLYSSSLYDDNALERKGEGADIWRHSTGGEVGDNAGMLLLETWVARRHTGGSLSPPQQEVVHAQFFTNRGFRQVMREWRKDLRLFGCYLVEVLNERQVVGLGLDILSSASMAAAVDAAADEDAAALLRFDKRDDRFACNDMRVHMLLLGTAVLSRDTACLAGRFKHRYSAAGEKSLASPEQQRRPVTPDM